MKFRYLWMISLLWQFIIGCGAMKNGRGWGQDATLLPGTKRIGQAALKAVSDPKTWGPAAGAAFLGFARLDQEVSQWAYTQTPVFGSQENAMEWSDNLLLTSKIIWVSSVLITPSGNNLQEIAFAKFKGIAVEALAVSATINLTGLLKNTTRRTRPNNSDNDSFPSAHASYSSVYSSLAMRNLDAVSIDSRFKKTFDIAMFTMASATAWARVEAQIHYPSDVLFGMALGNFMAVFFTEAFMGSDSAVPLTINFIPATERVFLLFRVQF